MLPTPHIGVKAWLLLLFYLFEWISFSFVWEKLPLLFTQCLREISYYIANLKILTFFQFSLNSKRMFAYLDYFDKIMNSSKMFLYTLDLVKDHVLYFLLSVTYTHARTHFNFSTKITCSELTQLAFVVISIDLVKKMFVGY